MRKETGTHIIVIMAGGSGTRLWPLSRKSQPKQFHAFLSDKTLLEETYDRAKGIVPETSIFISANEAYLEKILDIFPDFPKERLILEPSPRGTAPAIGLVAAVIEAALPGAIIATIASDHAIENQDAFTTAIKTAFSAVERNRDSLVVVGINPTSPDTGLGYIRMGERCRESGTEEIFSVNEFKEKPDQATAESYIANWRYLWNAGYFIFSAEAMLGWIDTYAPELAKITRTVSQLAKQDTLSHEALADIYEHAPIEAIEPLIVEKLPAASRIVVPAPIRWSDIGSWSSLYEFFHARHGKESVISGDCIEYDGKRNLIYGTKKRLIATFGVKDLVVVDTEDALLIADRRQSGDIKKLIEELKQKGRRDLL